MHIPWQDCEVFVCVAEVGSFSAAARQLRLTQPTVSRRIAALEEELGRALFRRDSEGAHLTAEGTRLLPAARQMSRWAAEMARLASGWEETASGQVRIAAPPGFAFEVLVPLAQRAREELPDLRFDIITGIEHIDLTRGDADLAVRTRAPTQAELVVQAEFSSEVAVFVSRRLSDELGPGPVAAASLPWVTWAYPLEHVAPRPQLEQLPGLQIGFASNDYLVQRRAVELGLGAFILPRTVDPGSPWGELVEIETDLPLPARQSMYVVCARSMRHVPRVQAALRCVIDAMGRMRGVRVDVVAG